MTKHLEHALNGLKRDVLKMCGLVEAQLDGAISALVRRRADAAFEVVQGDDALDEWDVHVEEEVLKILALHQPVAQDLRFVIAAVKINADLERMGDLAANIAERARELASLPPLPAVDALDRMADRVKEMVKASVEALVHRDPRLARKVLGMDALVDELYRELFEVYQTMMKQDPETVPRAVQMLSCSRHLERIGDHAKNIAEDVVYLVEGEIIRHRRSVPQARGGGAKT
jgi:phosphate transport system protein